MLLPLSPVALKPTAWCWTLGGRRDAATVSGNRVHAGRVQVHLGVGAGTYKEGSPQVGMGLFLVGREGMALL